MLGLRTWGTVRAACRQSGPYAGTLGSKPYVCKLLACPSHEAITGVSPEPPASIPKPTKPLQGKAQTAGGPWGMSKTSQTTNQTNKQANNVLVYGDTGFDIWIRDYFRASL